MFHLSKSSFFDNIFIDQTLRYIKDSLQTVSVPMLFRGDVSSPPWDLKAKCHAVMIVMKVISLHLWKVLLEVSAGRRRLMVGSVTNKEEKINSNERLSEVG